MCVFSVIFLPEKCHLFVFSENRLKWEIESWCEDEDEDEDEERKEVNSPQCFSLLFSFSELLF